MTPTEKVLFTTKDPNKLFDGRPLPAMTTMLHSVCGNDPEKFQEACRLLELFIGEALKPKPNTLMAIGWLGGKTVYFNISREEAIRRYLEKEGGTEDELVSSDMISGVIEFDDEFWAYDIGK